MTGTPALRNTRTPRVGSQAAKRDSRRSAREDRYAARNVLWRESSLSRVRACGLHHQGTTSDPMSGKQVSRDPYVSVVRTHTKDGNRAGFSGVQSCGSTWACPVCSEKIQAARADEVTQALAEAQRRGWVVGFLTFTVRHSKRHSLRGVWGAVSKGWRTATSGSRAAWEVDRDRFGLVGYLRLTEATVGANGWHVHIHALVFLDPAAATFGHIGVTAVEALGASMGERWAKGVRSVGRGYAPSKRRGADARLVVGGSDDLAAYFAKNVYSVKSNESAAADVTLSHAKQARHGNVTPFGLLARLVATGDADDLDLWHEWERESKGKRQLLWSNGLRADLLGDSEGATDEELAADDALDGVELVRMHPKAYRRLAHAGVLALVLNAAEAQDDGHALYEVLHDFGIPWELPPPEPRD